MPINSGMMSSKTPEWATPQAFFDKLDKEFHFTLDVCATPENAKCPEYGSRAEARDIMGIWRNI